MGEGTFLDLLDFIEKHAPDPVTGEVVRRARVDEGRHVAYGIAHARQHLRHEPAQVDELIAAAEERAAALQATSGTNPHVIEALAILAGGGSKPRQMERGLEAVRALYQSMDDYRVLFSNYEAQIEALFNRQIELAWNTNVAYVRCEQRAVPARCWRCATPISASRPG